MGPAITENVSFVQQQGWNAVRGVLIDAVGSCAEISVRYLSSREMGALVCIFLLGMGQLAVLQHKKAQTRF
jgi:hypothetical protein